MNVYWIQKEIRTYIIENKTVVTKNERKGGKDKLGVWGEQKPTARYKLDKQWWYTENYLHNGV